jgi:hypothetical protein
MKGLLSILLILSIRTSSFGGSLKKELRVKVIEPYASNKEITWIILNQ